MKYEVGMAAHQSLTNSHKKIIYRRPGYSSPGEVGMEKAFERLAGGGGSHGSSSGTNAPSKGFQNLIRGIAEAKTKHEEDRIIRNEAMFLKDRIGDPDITGRQMKELLIRILYCEMLGHNCEWGYIHAVKLTQKGNLFDKRIGYLAASLCLHEGHELNMLLVNTLQKDLKSSNILEVSMALNVICRLVSKEMIPAFLPMIQEKMVHPKELIRKKALMVMHRFYVLSPTSITHLYKDFRRCLSDSDPGVMDTCLVLLYDLVKDDPGTYKDLTTSLVHILDQVINRKLPADFDYHGVPAPWTQMKLLQLLAILGSDDQTMSKEIYKTLQDTLASSECTSNIGLAVTFECVKTITTIYNNPSLITKAAHSVGRFLNSANNNWKCLGITALGLLVQVDAVYTTEHQMVVIDCLDDPDDTLKRKTLNLLFKMTNSLNVVVIADKLIAYLKTTRDEYIKADLVSKITQLAERYAPDNQWFIRTMNVVFEVGGDLVRKEVAHNLMRLIAEGTEDEETDSELRQDAVACYIELINKPNLPDILIKIICWVVGEYAYMCEDINMEEILRKITSLLNRTYEDPDTQGWIITAITKLVSQMGNFTDEAQSHVACYLASINIDLQQRCSELAELSHNLPVMQRVLPVDASCEDLEVDASLSFLDDYVSEALEKGATPYKPAHMRKAERPQEEAENTAVTAPAASEIKITPYERPSLQPVYHVPPSMTSYPDNTLSSTPPSSNMLNDVSFSREQTTHPIQDDNTYQLSSSPRLPKKGARVWGSTGYMKMSSYPTASLDPPSNHIDNRNSLEDSTGQSAEEDGEREQNNEATTEPMVAPSKVTATPVMSAEEVKKRELASALFGGGGGINREGMLTGTGRSPRKQKKATTSESAASKTTTDNTATGSSTTKRGSAPNVTQTDLLLDIDFSSSSGSSIAGVTQNQPQPVIPDQQVTPSSGSGTMFDSLDIRTQPVATATTTNTVTAAAPPANTSSTGGLFGDLVDLFGSNNSGSFSQSPQPAPQNISQATPTSLLSTSVNSNTSGGVASTDAFSNLLDTPGYSLPSQQQQKPAMPPGGGQQDGPLAITLFEAPLSELRIPAELEVFPVAPGGSNIELCCDDSLRVTVTKVMKPKELVLVLFLTNQKQTNLVDVVTSIGQDISSNLKATLTNPHDNNTFVDQLSSFATCRHLCSVVPVSPGHNMNIHGKVTYKIHTSTKRLFFDLTIQCVDLIRPLQMDTDSFGKKWGSFKNEKRHKKVTSHVKTPEMYTELVKTKLNFHPIQIIGKEAIAAGTFLPSTPCLLHGKLSGGGLDVWVKSNSSVLTDSFSKEVLSALGVS